jgi:hypothetical protein
MLENNLTGQNILHLTHKEAEDEITQFKSSMQRGQLQVQQKPGLLCLTADGYSHGRRQGKLCRGDLLQHL